MAPKYYSSEETAKALGVSEAEVKQMAQRQQLHGYRDGAQWKFKAEEVDQLVRQRSAPSPPDREGGESDVLLSELELGPSASSASGTVIGGVDDGGKASADSDLAFGEGPKPPRTAAADGLDSKVSQFEELDLALEQDLTLEDSKAPSDEKEDGGGSSVDVAGKDLEDDDLVLGGSGTGSDITIGGDSGISLIDPADSGLSLEEPLGTAGGEESLELGEDDMIAVGEPAEADSPTELKTDDDFLLTPLEEVSEEEDSESGSQVIALDLEGDEAATMIADTAGGSGVAAMLDEDLSPEPAVDLGLGAAVDAAALGTAPLGVPPGAFVEGAPLGQAAVALPEAPYTVWNIISLSVCSLLLILVGMMMYDLLRNMWSWGGASAVNSSIMDFILNLF